MKSIPKEILERERVVKWKELRFLENRIEVIKKDIEAINNQLQKTL